MVSAAGFVLFVLHQPLPGYALLAAALVVAALVDRLLCRDLALIAAGVAIISAVPITTDVSTSHMLVMGSAMIAAVGIPYAVSRFVTKEHAVVFPVLTGPAVHDPEGIARLFIGTNALGIWDELFFICTCFALLRRHLPDWQANLLQAVLFTSFLWELGFKSWAPFFIYPFALLQARIFTVTKSLSYIVSVHLLFDFVLFLVLLHAHNRTWIDIFLY